MTPNKKKHLINDIFVVIMLLAALLTIIRLWPLLLLLLIGLIAYALWVLSVYPGNQSSLSQHCCLCFLRRSPSKQCCPPRSACCNAVFPNR